MTITSLELVKIQEKWLKRRDTYTQLSDYVLERCHSFRQQQPTVVRIVFSREPKVKTLSSIVQKIEARRKDTPAFKYEDLTDIVALTVLCPYASDVQQFIGWMKTAFDVHTADAEAYRDYATGHRGYHYVVSLTDPELANRPHLNVKCELQIKTLLQEAFDAKSHDLAYKPGYLKVGDDLQTQFSVLSSALGALDKQSEFLKDLILREQHELDLRRNACLELYLRNYGEMAERLGINPATIGASDVLTVIQKLKSASVSLMSGDFCKFAAYCALKLNHELLKDKAVEYTDQWVTECEKDVHRLFVRGSIKWVLGRFEGAFEDLSDVIERASEAGDDEEGRRAKNNLIYFVCDCQLFKHHVDDQWLVKIEPYVKEIRDAHTGNESDTVGFYLIMFGKTPEEIEEGRSLLRTSSKNRTDQSDEEIYTRFKNLHEYVALRRLLQLAKASLNY